jgi:predicted phosphodiesterase
MEEKAAWLLMSARRRIVLSHVTLRSVADTRSAALTCLDVSRRLLEPRVEIIIYGHTHKPAGPLK